MGHGFFGGFYFKNLQNLEHSKKKIMIYFKNEKNVKKGKNNHYWGKNNEMNLEGKLSLGKRNKISKN